MHAPKWMHRNVCTQMYAAKWMPRSVCTKFSHPEGCAFIRMCAIFLGSNLQNLLLRQCLGNLPWTACGYVLHILPAKNRVSNTSSYRMILRSSTAWLVNSFLDRMPTYRDTSFNLLPNRKTQIFVEISRSSLYQSVKRR